MSEQKAALLIGVSSYAAYDTSAGLPAGTSDLRGPRNDVLAWLAVARALGIPRVRILTTPPLTPQDLPDATGVELGEATGEAIAEGVRWIAGQLAGDAPGQGLLASASMWSPARSASWPSRPGRRSTRLTD